MLSVNAPAWLTSGVQSRCLAVLLLLTLLVQNGCWAGRSPRRFCQNSEIEVFSERGMKIEPVAQSRVEISLINVYRLYKIQKTRFHLQLDFKTRSPNGILFYGRSPYHPGQLIAISLLDGKLLYTIRCPTLHADLVVPTRDRTPLNDGRWHSINYTVKYSPSGQNKIVIDGYSNTKRYEVTCAPLKSIVLGGLSPRDVGEVREFEGLRGHFEGCIKNLRIPAPFRKPPKYFAVSVCD